MDLPKTRAGRLYPFLMDGAGVDESRQRPSCESPTGADAAEAKADTDAFCLALEEEARRERLARQTLSSGLRGTALLLVI